MRPGRDGDSGEGLIETLISVLFITLTFSALLAVVGAGSTLSATHRKDSIGDTALRSYAEIIKRAPYVVGANDAAYNGAASSAGYSAPSGYTLSVTKVRCLNSGAGGDANLASTTQFPVCTVAGDKGLQLVAIRVLYDGNTQSLTLLKRQP